MASRIHLGSFAAEVTFKDIKNVHLSVHPPAGRVTISAPRRMALDTVRVFAISKLDWIKRQQKRIREQEREPEREYLDRESHFLWGRRYLLSVTEADAPPEVRLQHNRMKLTVRPNTDRDRRHKLVEAWYRQQLRQAVPELVAKWEPLLGVRVARVYVQRMRTRWGSCNPTTASIRLNTDLAKKPRECLEYLVVHEMLHLIEPTHNARFVALMDRYLPNWNAFKQLLNRLPVRHEDWEY